MIRIRSVSYGGMLTVLGIIACHATPAGEQQTAGSALIELRLVRDGAGPGLQPTERAGETLYLEPEPVLSDEDFEVVRAVIRGGELSLDYQAKPDAAARLEAVTQAEIGTRLAVIVDSEVRSAPVIRDMLGARGVMLIQTTPEEATRLAAMVRARWPQAGA